MIYVYDTLQRGAGMMLAYSIVAVISAVAAFLCAQSYPKMDARAHAEALRRGSAPIELFYPGATALVFSWVFGLIALVCFMGILIKLCQPA